MTTASPLLPLAVVTLAAILLVAFLARELRDQVAPCREMRIGESGETECVR